MLVFRIVTRTKNERKLPETLPRAEFPRVGCSGPLYPTKSETIVLRCSGFLYHANSGTIIFTNVTLSYFNCKNLKQP